MTDVTALLHHKEEEIELTLCKVLLDKVHLVSRNRNEQLNQILLASTESLNKYPQNYGHDIVLTGKRRTFQYNEQLERK